MKIAALLKLVAVQEDWGSSDWYPIMKSMKKYVDEKFDGKQTDENLKAAALQAVPFYMEDMGYDDEEDAADAAVRTFKARRKFPESGLAESRLEEGRGVFIVKSKDGVEKRFRGVGPQNNLPPAAHEWKESYAKKPAKEKHEKFSQGWWEAKEEADEDAVMPWTKIKGHDLTDADLKRAFQDAGADNVDDWHIDSQGEKKIDGVFCATVKLRLHVTYTKDDDMGSDEDISDAVYITVNRDPKNPKKFVFHSY